MCFVGVLLGALVFGNLSDRYGRRPTVIWTVFLLSVVSLVGSFVTSFTLYTALRFLAGVCCGGAILVSTAYI